MFQAQSLESFETTPLVVDGVMYLTEAPNTALALDARTGRPFWRYQYNPSADSTALLRPRESRARDARQHVVHGDDRLEAHRARRDHGPAAVAEDRSRIARAGYAMTLAPLVVKDKVIIGVAGGEYGIRGFIAAHDAATGDEAWRFYTIPAPGEPGFETWADGGDAWQRGGASVWLTGSYDAALDLTYWGIGNPGPDWNPAQRPGDNLYSDSVVALDPDTGELKWHFQFTPNDDYDYDAVQIPVLVDLPTASASSGKLMLWANRNGFFYVLDRATGEFIRGEPFVNVNWASGLDESGRPIETPQPLGSVTFPGVQGGTNWYSPSYQPAHRAVLFLRLGELRLGVSACGGRVSSRGARSSAASPRARSPARNNVPGIRRGPINNWTEALGNGAVIALDPRTGRAALAVPDDRRLEQRRSHDGHGSRLHRPAATATPTRSTRAAASCSGARAPAGRARTARCLTPSTARQYVALGSGSGLFVFGLRD